MGNGRIGFAVLSIVVEPVASLANKVCKRSVTWQENAGEGDEECLSKRTGST